MIRHGKIEGFVSRAFGIMSRDSRTHYQLLGLSPAAAPGDIERAYRKLRGEMQEDVAAPDARRTVLLQTAYETLSDPARRAGYDGALRSPREVLRRVSARQRAQWIGGSVLLAAAAAAAWYALRPAAPTAVPRDAAAILADASLAVAGLKLVELSGTETDVGLAFALDKGALATSCAGIKAPGQLLVSFARRKVPARVAREGASVCRLTAEGLGSWPLQVRESVPARGEKIYAVRLDTAGQAYLLDGSVRAVSASDDGVQTIEVSGAAAGQPAGGPLIDTQGRVLGIALGSGRYRPVPSQWMAELRAPPEDLPAPRPRTVAPKAKEPKPQLDEDWAHQRAKALKMPDDI